MPIVQCTKCGCDIHLTGKEWEEFSGTPILCDDCYDDKIHNSRYDYDEFSDADYGL